MARHGNSLENDKVHHLYEIYDNELDDTFKYGISDKPIGKDGLSSRVREQVNMFNLVVGWIRFFGRILIKGIQGRKKARDLEDKHIDDYVEKQGKRPRGNLR